MSNASKISDLQTALKQITGLNVYIYPIDPARVTLPMCAIVMPESSLMVTASGYNQFTDLNITLTIIVQSNRDETTKLSAMQSLLNLVDTIKDKKCIEIKSIKTGADVITNKEVYFAEITGLI
jgi:hypothetical protein